MPNAITERWNALRAAWTAASLQTRVGVISVVALLAAGAILYAARGNDPSYDVLFANLSTEDAARIVERLRDEHVPYRLGEDGRSVMVPSDRVHETRLSLAGQGLPSGGGVGFEIFDQQRFGESEFAEQVQYRRALEGELARTIRSIAGVESARVHLVLPQRTLFGSTESHATASVALRLRTGFTLREEQVHGIVHLVASSVRELSPEDVTLVDGEGRPLTEGANEETEGAEDAEELRRRVERARQRTIQDLLDATLGPGVAYATVAADVTFTREERVEETYDPDRVATRSFQITSEGGDAAAAGTQGVPGAVSALPGGAAAEPTAGSTSAGGRRSEVRNFEITKVVRRAVEPVGRITRLSVAVMVDGRMEGDGDARHFVPRNSGELDQIRAVVSSAAGLQTERGDVVTVESVPFAARETPEEEGAESSFAQQNAVALAVGGVVLAALIAGAVAFAMRRRRLAREAVLADERQRAEAATAAALAAGHAATLLEAQNIDGANAKVDLSRPGMPQLPEEREMPIDPEEIRRLTLEVARSEPLLAARVIQTWMSEDAA